MSEYTPTTQQVEDGYAHEPEYEYHNPVDCGAHVHGNRRAFRRWLKEHDAEVERAAAEKAWAEAVMFIYANAWVTLDPGLAPVKNPYQKGTTND